MMNRRQFLARSALCGAALGLGLGAPGRLLAAASKGKTMGIQLYMVLDAYKADPMGTLKTLKSIGYAEIEAIILSTAEELRDQLKAAGLASPSLHFDSLGFDKGVEAAHTLASPAIRSTTRSARPNTPTASARRPTRPASGTRTTTTISNSPMSVVGRCSTTCC